MWDDEIEEPRVFINLGDLDDYIVELEGQQPKDKRKKGWKDWMAKLNVHYKLYNEMAGFKVYKISK